MEKTEKYNDATIKKTVTSLNDCIKKIKEELRPDKNKDLISNLEDTVTTLKETDNLMVVQKEIQNQIIAPVNKLLKKSTKSNILIGWVGISAAVIGIVIATFLSKSTSHEVNSLRSNLNGVRQQVGKNIEADDKIYTNIKGDIDILKKDFGKTENYISKKNKLIFENIDKNTVILKEIQDKFKGNFKYDTTWGITEFPSSFLHSISPGTILGSPETNLFTTIPETKKED